MSLKHFHLLFVITAAVMALFCAAQALAAYRADGQRAMAALAVVAVLGVAALVRFEMAFLRRCRQEGV